MSDHTEKQNHYLAALAALMVAMPEDLPEGDADQGPFDQSCNYAFIKYILNLSYRSLIGI